MIILNFLIQAIKIIVALSVLVIIHEAGHMMVAKLFKIPVKEFSVGFGKKICSKEIKGTIYSIRLFLLGGYVDIDDEDREGTFANAPLYQKNLILLAGVFVNFMFALIVGIIVLFAQGEFTSNIIDSVSEKAPIYSYEIKQGDEIYKINGKKIKSKSQIDTVMSLNNGENINIQIKRNNQIIDYSVKPYVITYPSIGVSVSENNIVIAISGNENNLKIDDKILEINDVQVNDTNQLIEQLLNTDDKKVTLKISRDGKEIKKQVNLEKYTKSYLGVTLKKVNNTFLNKLKYSFIGIGDYIYETFRGLILLITGQNQNAQLMGIIGVSQIITQTSSIIEYLGIMVSISLSLAIVNLFPLPILDGGKIVIYTIEKYRKKQFNESIINIITTITMILLILLTIYIMIQDIKRIV